MPSNMPFITGPELPVNRSSRFASQDRTSSFEVIAIYPMTRSQEGLWLAYSLSPHATHYNLTLKFTLSREMGDELNCSLEGLHKAINILTSRHAMLRSTFHNADKNHPRPFIAERDPALFSPFLQIVTKSTGPQAEAKVLSLLRTAIDLSTAFAVRWLAVLGTEDTELYLVSHHIALDGKSMSQLSKEFWELLAAKSRPEGNASQGVQLQPFYRTHTLENAFLNSPDFAAAKAFWLSQSRNVRPLRWKGTPSSDSSSNRKDYRQIQTWFEFSNSELRNWGNRYQTSWFRVAVSLLGVLMRSIAEPDGGADHAVMIAFAGRPTEMENSVGQFANAVPIRIPLASVFSSTSPTFAELVRLVSKAVSSGKRCERFSYPDVVNAHRQIGLQIPPPQVAITFSPKLSRPESSLYPVEGEYDLFFCFIENEESVSLGVIYNPLVFSDRDILTLKATFSALHKVSINEEPFTLSSLSWMKPHFPHLLTEINLENVDEINAARFHTWFENRTAHDPDLLALYSGERRRSITYQKLNEKANQKAHYLRKMGICRGSTVILHLSRGFHMMEWIIAVLKSGAAFSVADQMRPVMHTHSVISIAQPALIVDDGNGHNLTQQAAELHTKILDMRTISFEDMPTHNLDDVTQNDDLAYISFTSGSTGQPKGVEIEHRNLSHFIANAYSSHYVSVSPGSRVLQWATFAFDAAVIEWAQCLTLGGTLCFADVPQALMGDYLADVIDANDISFINVTSSVLATLPTSRTLPSLRQISVGGEMVPENLLSVWRTRVHVQNAYGPTECTAVMSHHPQPRTPEEEQPRAGIIGVPHRHMKFVISDDTFTRILPVNETGEVCISGPQVGRGYRGRADLTSSRFAVHPELGERVYRTGDRGKILADGSVLLVGRIDREVKLRGYRIELDSIERIIYQVMPDIIGVSLQLDESGSSLYAFVAPQSIDGNLLKSLVSQRLPSYMVPTSVYSLKLLPLSTNGKVDHKMIKAQMNDLILEARKLNGQLIVPSPTNSSIFSESYGIQSLSEIKTISRIWKNVLNLSQPPCPTDNFFDLGGNSLSIQTLADNFKSEFLSAKLTVMDLFANATILAQAELVKGRKTSRSNTSTPQTPPLPAYSVSGDENVESSIMDIWKTVLGVEKLSPTANFFNVGGNSLSLSQLLGNIHLKWPSLDINVTDLFHHVTARSQANVISARLQKLMAPPMQIPLPQVQQAAKRSSFEYEIAIVGLAGRRPGASTPDELFQLLLDKREGLTTFPQPESETAPFKDAIYIPKRGAIPDVEKFDHARWGLKEDQARDMDPQQRLFLDVAREALEDSGHLPSSDDYNSIGLCVGAAHDTWGQHHEPIHGDEFHKAHRSSITPSISARTAYHLNLHGPNVTLNTACSSGLVAMSLAIDHLRSGQCDISIAGGVSITFPQQGYFTAKNQLFSPSGHCKPFDDRADGTLPGDAVCAVVLRRLNDAIRDGDKIYSVVSGIAIGSDGSTEKAGYLAPSARGQANTIVRAWKDSGLPASKLVYAELHGSGTAIGDAIELEGLNIARTELNVEKVPISVGSNKGNLGNCEAAGGLISVIKMSKSMEKGVIPPMPSFEKLNRMVNSNMPITVTSSEVLLSSDSIVSVSSIGLGGVNAHCILRSPRSQFPRH